MPCPFCRPAQIAHDVDCNARPPDADEAALPFGTGYAEHLTDETAPANRRVDAVMKGCGRCLQSPVCPRGLLRIWRIASDAKACRQCRLAKPRISWQRS